MRFISCMLMPVFLMMLASVALFENISAQSLCDTLFIPRGNMFPAERRELCQADTIILQGVRPENGYEMRWFRNGVELAGQTQEILKVTQAGTYSFRLFGQGCLSADFDTVRIRFRNQPRPKIRLLTLQQVPASPGSQFTLQLQNIGNSESTVQSWFRNDVLENSSGLTLTGRNTGRYRVRTDSAGCSSFSNEVLVRPAGSFVPQICLSEPVEPNGLKIEWIPPASTSVQQFRVYRKKYYESAFSFVEAVNPGAATWQNDTILYRSAYDVMLTARVNGPGGTYESEPSPINKTIYLQVQPAPAGSTGNVLSWNSYQGFPVNRYYILRNEQLLDSVPGTQNTWLDANPPANAVYRIEAQATENCTSVMSDIDGNVYQTVQIGNQVWMKENLRVSKYRNGDPIPTGLDSASWQFTNSGAYAVYDNASGNNTLYGKLYNWHAVMDPRGLCPAGWHAPTDTEWQTLESFLGMPSSELNLTGFNNPRGQAQNVGGKLKAVSNLWTAPNVGATNESGFTALPGGFRRDTGQYVGIASNGYWWTTLGARSRWLAFGSAAAFRQNSLANYGFSVRCLKDSAETGLIDSLDCAGKVQMNYLAENSPADNVQIMLPYFGGNGGSHQAQSIPSAGVNGLTAVLNPGNLNNGNDSLTYRIIGTPAGLGTATFSISIGGKQCNIEINVADTGSVHDIDGNLYTSIKIGNQEWMQQNLKVSKYQIGDPITTNLDNTQWSAATEGAFSVYLDNDTNDLTYGKLYNWYAVADLRGLCPVGWHVPTDHDWNLLTKYLDPAADTTCFNCASSTIAGGKMKSTGTIQAGTGLWQNPNTDAANISGFTGHPGGYRGDNGAYYSIGNFGVWWSSTENSSAVAWARNLGYYGGSSTRYYTYKTRGFSVRCLRD